MWTIHGKSVPGTIDELLRPDRTAHVVIDLQNDCCHPEGSCAQAGADVSRYPQTIARVVQLVEASRRIGVLQVFVRMLTLPNGASDSPSWIRLRQRLAIQYAGAEQPATPVEFCMQGTWGAELVDDLKSVAQESDPVVYKHRSSAFFGTNLDMLLRSNGISTVMFTGCTTEGCLESTVRDAGFLDYFPVVIEDGVNSDVVELHNASLRVMRAYRADVITADEALAAFGRSMPQEASV